MEVNTTEKAYVFSSEPHAKVPEFSPPPLTGGGWGVGEDRHADIMATAPPP